MMQLEHIRPFVEATVDTFSTMCGVTPKRDGKLDVRVGLMGTYELISVIGLTGEIRGAVMLSMPLQTGMQVVGAFIGEPLDQANAELMDGYGEIVNIIAGSAAAKLDRMAVNLALPTVFLGKDMQTVAKDRTPWIVIPMVFTEWGKFNIEVSIEGR